MVVRGRWAQGGHDQTEIHCRLTCIDAVDPCLHSTLARILEIYTYQGKTGGAINPQHTLG